MKPVADVGQFAKDHVEGVRFEASSQLAEEAIHCLELVSELVAAGLSFQFKGGNSLLLILPRPRRFSIDVDIATDEPIEKIEQVLDHLVGHYGVFRRWEKRQHKTKPWIPLSSYYLYYDSLFDSPQPASVMLDVQIGRSPYATELRPVQCGNLYRSPVKVEVPRVASLVGDKLLTLGPYTLGIPVGKNKEAQRIKHVFDVSTLLTLSPKLDEIRSSFHACTAMENRLQQKSIRAEQLLSDTLALCASVVKHPFTEHPPEDMPPVFVENVKGLQPFSNHLFSRDYTWHSLQCDMARVAMCITAVCIDEVTNSEFEEILSTSRPCSPEEIFEAANRLENRDEEVRLYWDYVCDWMGRREEVS